MPHIISIIKNYYYERKPKYVCIVISGTQREKLLDIGISSYVDVIENEKTENKNKIRC